MPGPSGPCLPNAADAASYCKRSFTMAVTKEEIVETLKGMSAIELSELVHELEEVFGVSAAPVAVAAVGGAAPEAEEKTEFDVVPTRSPSSRWSVSLPAWASRRPRTPLTVAPRPCSRASTRRRPTRPRPSSKRLVPLLPSSSFCLR